MKKLFTLILSAASLTAFAQGGRTNAAFTPGSVVIYRIGDGSGTLTNKSARVFLDEYSPAGVLLQSIPMPTTASGANGPLVAAGSASNEGMINRSVDSAYLVFGGYSADTGISNIATSSSATNKRTVGRVDASGVVNTSTIFNTSFTGGSIRSVASPDGNELWMVGNNAGVRYADFGDTSAVRWNTSGTGATSNFRDINIYGGLLYVTSSSGSIRIATVGTSFPPDSTGGGATIYQLSGIPSSGSPNQIFMADIDASVPGPDVLYVADDVQASGAGIKKYSKNSTTQAWDSTGYLFVGSGTRGLTGYTVGNAVTLFATTPTKLARLIDIGGYNGPINGTADSIAGAATGTAFRGVAQAPIARITPLTLISFKGNLTTEGSVLTWKTANEANVNSYSVERSTDGARYTSIGTVAATNRSEASYSFNDDKPANGANFYRLKMIDNDGKFKYSNIVVISNRKGVKSYVYPNPATDRITVSHGKATSSATIRILDAEGRQMRAVGVQPGALQTSININELAKGNYVVVFVNDGETSITRFVK